MPRLIHLNGPSRVGKSTLARRYVNEHPGTLCLDLDVLVGLIGGWRNDFAAALSIARAHASALATRHLRDGHDVMVPQLVTIRDDDPDAGLEDAAHAVDATYIEVALLVDDDAYEQRLHGKEATNQIEAQIQTWLEDPDSDLADRIRRHFAAYLADRPDAIRIDTTDLDEDATYARLAGALAAYR